MLFSKEIFNLLEMTLANNKIRKFQQIISRIIIVGIQLLIPGSGFASIGQYRYAFINQDILRSFSHNYLPNFVTDLHKTSRKNIPGVQVLWHKLDDENNQCLLINTVADTV